MKHLAELKEVVLAGDLDGAADEDEHAAAGAGGLAVGGADVVEALLELEARQLLDDRLRPLKLLPLERQHRRVLVQVHQRRPVRVEGGVVVLDERLGNGIGIHGDRDRDLGLRFLGRRFLKP